MAEDMGYELSWDAAIEKESPEFILLPEGDYEFTVTKFERARHNGSDKLPPCNKAILYLSIETHEGMTVIQHQLFLNSKMEGTLSAFFAAIGQKKKNEKITMNWNTVVGSKGRCKVYIDIWTGRDGEEKKSNKIRKFYNPEDQIQNTSPNATAGGFTAGRF